MFDGLVLAFYWVDSTENCGVFFSIFVTEKCLIRESQPAKSEQCCTHYLFICHQKLFIASRIVLTKITFQFCLEKVPYSWLYTYRVSHFASVFLPLARSTAKMRKKRREMRKK